MVPLRILHFPYSSCRQSSRREQSAGVQEGKTGDGKQEEARMEDAADVFRRHLGGHAPFYGAYGERY